jgi:hypothetical protein
VNTRTAATVTYTIGSRWFHPSMNREITPLNAMLPASPNWSRPSGSVYSITDGSIPMLARIYARRLRGYRAIGYELEVGDPIQRNLFYHDA